MTSDSTLASWDDQLLDVVEPVRRVAAARVRDRHLVDDVVQETLARLLAARDRLDASSLLPYALVTARNLTADAARDRDRTARLLPRVPAGAAPVQPEDALLRSEERQALAAALDSLPEGDRRLLWAHEVDEVDTSALAEAAGNTAGGIAARLARARARVRLDYILALHNGALPTKRCRPVLAALSSGDLRRQRALDAGAHLLHCATCAELSGAVLARRRRLSAVLPWVWLPALGAAVRRAARGRSSPAAAGAAALAAVVVAVVAATSVLTGHSPPAPRRAAITRPPPADLTVDGRELPAQRAALHPYLGRPVRAERVLVLAVPADEGFWVRAGRSGRIWVALATRVESPPTVRPGQRVSFTGTLVPTSASFARAAGVRESEGADELLAQGAHVRVAPGALRIARS